MNAEWFGIGLTIALGAIACGRLWQKVNGNAAAHEHCERRREEMEQRLFDKLEEMAEGVNKIKGALRIDGD